MPGTSLQTSCQHPSAVSQRSQAAAVGVVFGVAGGDDGCCVFCSLGKVLVELMQLQCDRRCDG